MKKRSGWNEALVVRCPTCFQPYQAKCVSLETGAIKRWVHPKRQRVYLDSLKIKEPV